jgi:hypothetical protein
LESPRGSGRSPCLADLPFLRDQTLKVSQYTVHESIPEGDTMAGPGHVLGTGPSGSPFEQWALYASHTQVLGVSNMPEAGGMGQTVHHD